MNLKNLFLLSIGILLGLCTMRYFGNPSQSLLALPGTPQLVGTPDQENKPSATAPSHNPVTVTDVLTSRRNAIVEAVEKSSPSVVSITVRRSQVVAYADPFFEFFGPQYRKREFSSLGSGVIVSEQGFILTNAHVLGGEEGSEFVAVKVTLADGRQFSAKVVGFDSDNDVGVIRISGSNLPVAHLQKASDNLIGEWAIAIGNPYGYLIGDTKPTITVGVISAVGRTFSSQSGIHYNNMIQTDASINPGNSGGALVNAAGELIGINTFIFTGSNQSQGSIGLGFAIPIQKAKAVMDELIQYGHIRQFTTGIYTDPSAELPISGVLVTQLDKGSPGEKAGLAPGDIITKVAGKPILSFRDIQDIFKLFQVGEQIDIEFVRKAKPMRCHMVLEEEPQRRRKLF